MTPEIRGRIAAIRQELALEDTPEERKIALVKEAVQLTREARGIVAQAVEAKRPAKRAAKQSGDALLNDLLSKDA